MLKLDLQFFGGRGAGADIDPMGGGNPDSPSGIDKLPPQGAAKSLSETVTHVNPNFEDGREWKVNCNKCVLAYYMQRNGYDVTAGANQGWGDTFGYGFDRNGNPRKDIDNYITAFKNPTITGVNGIGNEAYNDIKRQMDAYGNGAMAILRVRWQGGNGHVFMVENHNGTLVFNDGQPSSSYGVGATNSEIRQLLKQTHNRGNNETKLIRVDNAGINEDVMKKALLPSTGQVRKSRRSKK